MLFKFIVERKITQTTSNGLYEPYRALHGYHIVYIDTQLKDAFYWQINKAIASFGVICIRLGCQTTDMHEALLGKMVKRH